MRRFFCFGLGYSGLRLARALMAEGWAVGGTCRDPAAAAALRAEGIDARPFPLPDPVEALAGVGHVLTTVPPGEGGDPVLEAHGAALAALPLAWFGYLSTTGVYGDHGGGWVDEATPPAPTNPRAARRVAAERAWTAAGVPLHVFRLPGIYGPGRSALDQVRAGQAKRIDKPGHVFSRIHVDDIVGAVMASMARPNPGAVYNLADDEPAPAAEVVAHACALLGVEPPPLVPFEAAALSPMGREFYADNRRVRAARIGAELGYRLRHPSYRDGLRAQIEAEAGGAKGP
ncbi:MAG TPA: SDR family oxidoreductase [Alphaproteobacteria bacterium]|nr:SDR family oxidoreductase [Alphaproteobacteria bacterium]